MKNVLIAGVVLLLMSGCKTTELQYYHGEYNKAVYSFFKAEDLSLDEQITVMNEVIVNAESKGKPVAPGIHAHLGMLYFESGNLEMGKKHFDKEKSLFPESAQFINFLMEQGKDI